MAETVSKQERAERLKEKWAGMTDEQRFDFTLELQGVQAGSDKKVAELTGEIETLKEQIEKATTEKADNSLDGLRQEAAIIHAQKIQNEKTANLLQRAIDEGVGAEFAVQFARADDPDRAFDAAMAEVNRIADERVNKRLTEVGEPEGTGKPAAPLDLSSMSAEEISRLPQSVVHRYMESVVESEVMG